MLERIRVAITGAAGKVAYSLLYKIAKGDVFGPDQPLILHLLDLAPNMGVVQGLAMELADCAFPLIHGVVSTDNTEEAFNDVSAAFLIGAIGYVDDMKREDVLTVNANIFKTQGRVIDKFARKDVKVVVVGNPATMNALVCAKYAPSIPKANFTALTRQDQSVAEALIAVNAGVPVKNVSNVIIWGNHSSTQFADATHASVIKNGRDVSVPDVIKNDVWLQTEFMETVRDRCMAIVTTNKLSYGMSAAQSVADHMRDWFLGTPPGKFVSMAVFSDGSYGAPKDVFFSFPVTIKGGQWEIVKDFEFCQFHQSLFEATGKELVEERAEIFGIVGGSEYKINLQL